MIHIQLLTFSGDETVGNEGLNFDFSGIGCHIYKMIFNVVSPLWPRAQKRKYNVPTLGLP